MESYKNLLSLEWFDAYKKWVVKNPQGATDMEALIKWGSYFLAGRLHNSTLLSEIVYSGSRLFEMFNDFLLRGTLPQLSIGQGNRLKIILSVVEYVEVLVEVAAVQLWGEAGRWAVVIILQIVKAVGRFMLLLHQNINVVPSPPLKPLNRRMVVNARPHSHSIHGLNSGMNPEWQRLSSSGRVIRTLAGAPPMHLRTFNPPKPTNDLMENSNNKSSKLGFKNLTAEILYIMRPLSHLTSMYYFGQTSWAPWFLSLGFDLTSLHLHKGMCLSETERSEITRRQICLLYYLVRSPAFHTVTHRRIKYFLNTVGNKIPLARSICQPLLAYIPEWQKIYAYTWS
ncbi:unnamed protein product [Meganyctiphanes norvegica]|uniref:Peroxisomal membrane protein PEX16 n=1 Tax=Meganyctiphanes norvegica TaxID=48144 RepID=A0AAV2SB51_MEGNR